nr:MAG TPA: hypothetical protein [Caudoviricetes sp.]
MSIRTSVGCLPPRQTPTRFTPASGRRSSPSL